MEQKIDPKKLIEELSVAELCQSAEEYYAGIPDATCVLAKPFFGLLETPQTLFKMGLLLYGLELGKSMLVLDFGAGACWFSRILNQLQCRTISVDVSKTALEMGKKLFEVSPILGEQIKAPQFVLFDGEHIQVDSNSVDRIVCFDTFHHIPNQRQVLSEFFRVLKPGGIAGFSEPGMDHSQTALSQYEMKHHTVLENDIRLGEINEIAQEVGFSDMRIKLVADPCLNLSCADYEAIINWSRPAFGQGLKANVRNIFQKTPQAAALAFRTFESIAPTMRNMLVFYLIKGMYMPDSRSPNGLKHEMKVLSTQGAAQVGQPMRLSVRVKNVGASRWLHQNIRDIGVVKVGVHLVDANQRIVENDFARGRLETDVLPGEQATIEFDVSFTDPGEYILALDLLAEHICWFEITGSQPQHLHVSVT